MRYYHFEKIWRYARDVKLVLYIVSNRMSVKFGWKFFDLIYVGNLFAWK